MTKRRKDLLDTPDLNVPLPPEMALACEAAGAAKAGRDAIGLIILGLLAGAFIALGAELFTGDSLMIVAFASRSITIGALLRAWLLVYVGNIAGAMGTVALVFLAGHHEFGNGAVGKTALTIVAAEHQWPPSAPARFTTSNQDGPIFQH